LVLFSGARVCDPQPLPLLKQDAKRVGASGIHTLLGVTDPMSLTFESVQRGTMRRNGGLIPKGLHQSAQPSEVFRQPIFYVLFTGLAARDFLNPKGIQIIQPRVASLRATLGKAIKCGDQL